MLKSFLIALGLVAPFVVRAQMPEAVLPFLPGERAIYVYGTLNGTDSLRFLFDTGADGSVVNKQSAGKIPLHLQGTQTNRGSNGTNTVEVAVQNTLSVGPLRKTDVSLTVIPYETAAFDGVLGTDMMKGHIIEIDHDRRELRFYDPRRYAGPPRGYEKHRIRYVKGYPAIKATIRAGKKRYRGLFGLDTGADDVLTLAAPFAARHDLAHALETIGRATSTGSDGSSYVSQVVELPELCLGRAAASRLPATLSSSTEGIDATRDMAGFFGNGLLERFNAVWDLDRGVLYLRPNSRYRAPF